MSTAIQNAIDELETELAGLDDKRTDLEKAIAVLQRLQGEGVTPNGSGRRPKAHRIVKRNGAVARVKPARAAGREASADSILAALKKRSPMSPGDLAKASGLSSFSMRMAVKALVKERKVEASGKTMSRLIGLPGKMTARGDL